MLWVMAPWAGGLTRVRKHAEVGQWWLIALILSLEGRGRVFEFEASLVYESGQPGIYRESPP